MIDPLGPLPPVPPEHLAGVLVGLAVVLTAVALARRADRARTADRLRTFVGDPRPVAALEPIARRARPRSEAKQIPLLGAQARDLAQAGLTITPDQFLRRQVLVGVVGLGLGWLLGPRLGLDGVLLLAAIPLGGVIGLWAARAFLRFRRGRRLRQFETQFASAVDALASALQAGLSLPQALDMLARDMPPPLGAELALVVRELNLGVPLEDALSNLVERVPSSDVDIFATAVQIQFRIGGNLSAILRSIGFTVRERLRIRREITVLTAQGRLSGYIISGLPVFLGLVLFLISPAYIGRLFEPGIGRALLGGAVFFGVVGFYAMRRITAIEV